MATLHYISPQEYTQHDSSITNINDLPSTEEMIEESLIYRGIECILEEIQGVPCSSNSNITSLTLDMTPTQDQESSLVLDQDIKIDLWQFLRRLKIHGGIKSTTLIYTCGILDRIEDQKQITSRNIIKLFTSLLYISMKYLYDEDYLSLDDYSLLVGISTQELLRMESLVLEEYLKWKVDL